MGNWDNKNYVITVHSKESLSDNRLIDLLRSGKNGSNLDLDSLCQEWGGFENTLADNILEFLFNYGDGFLMPDRWGYYEPIKIPVDVNSKNEIKDFICTPGTIVMLKRIRRPKYEAMIFNKSDIFLRQGMLKGRPFLRSSASVYQSSMALIFSKTYKVSIDLQKAIIKELGVLFKTDFGYLEDRETGEVLYDSFASHPDETLGMNKKYKILVRELLDWMEDYHDSKSDAYVSYFNGPMEESFQPHVRQMLKILSSLIRHYYPSLYCAVLFRHAGLLPLSQIYRLIIDRCSSDVVLKSIEFFISYSDPISLYESVGYKATRVEIPEIWDKPFYTLEPPAPNSSPMLLFL